MKALIIKTEKAKYISFVSDKVTLKDVKNAIIDTKSDCVISNELITYNGSPEHNILFEQEEWRLESALESFESLKRNCNNNLTENLAKTMIRVIKERLSYTKIEIS